MSELFSVDVGSLFPYFEEKLRSWFRLDAAHRQAREFLTAQLRGMTHDAQLVQIIGMDRPVSTIEIYQPTRLLQRREKSKSVDFATIIVQRTKRRDGRRD